MVPALSRAIPKEIYNAKNLEVSTFSKVGAAAVTLATLAGTCLTEEQKKEAAQAWVSLQKAFIDPHHVTDQDLLDTTLQSYKGIRNVVQSSPAFYGIYQLIHKSGLPFHHHVAQSAIRGINGTLKSAPILGIFYAAASFAIPKFQEDYEAKGMSKKDALSKAQAKTFILGGPIEFALEAIASGVKFGPKTLGVTFLATSLLAGRITPGALVKSPFTGQISTGAVPIPLSRLSLGLGTLGTLFLTGRLITGALTQFRAAGDTTNDPVQELQDYVITSVGTTLTQHPANAVLQTMTKVNGWTGLKNYLFTGTTSGIGSSKIAAAQFGATLFQRFVYTGLWNKLSHQKEETPTWAVATKMTHPTTSA